MPTGRVQSRGQVTLPIEVRRKAGISAGDTLNIEVIRPGEVRLKALPRLSPRELRERYPIEGPIREAEDRASWRARAAEDVVGD